MDSQIKAKKTYLQRRGWKDLIFLAVVLILGHWVQRLITVTDLEKWKARPQLSPDTVSSSQAKPGETGLAPSFFIVPSSAVDQPVVSGSVGDCLLLIPDGRKLDLIEVFPEGFVLPVKTDLFVEDSIPLAFTRTYLPKDDWSTRNRIFLPHVYDPFLWGSRFPYTYLDWMLPDRYLIHFGRISPGTGFADAVYENSNPGPIFGGSRAAWNGWGWDLALEDGTTYLSPEAYSAKRVQQGSLVGIFDKRGNEVRLLRNSDGDLTELQSPSGHWIRFRYDAGHLVQAADSLGNKVEYEYDADDRVRRVTYPSGQSTAYTYDTSNRVVSAEDSLRGIFLTVEYDANQGSVARVSAEGQTYGFQYTRDQGTNSGHVELSYPGGDLTRIKQWGTGGGFHYSVEKLGHDSARKRAHTGE